MKRVVVKKANSNDDVYAKCVEPTSTSNLLKGDFESTSTSPFLKSHSTQQKTKDSHVDQKKAKAKQDVDQLEKTVDETIKDTLKRIAKKRQQLKEIRDENADLKLTLERVRVRYMTTVWWIIMSCAWWLRLVTARDRQYLLYILCDVAFLANFRQVARTILLFVFKIIFFQVSLREENSKCTCIGCCDYCNCVCNGIVKREVFLRHYIGSVLCYTLLRCFLRHFIGSVSRNTLLGVLSATLSLSI